MDSFFRSVTEYPDRQDANGIVMRLLDGLGYRFYWATEGLEDADYGFSPGEGCMGIGDLVKHVWGLANWVHINLLGQSLFGDCPQDPAEVRGQILETLLSIRDYVGRVNSADLFACEVEGQPFWHVINGPLADALTHTGQIVSFRRLNGNPVLKHNVFLCRQKMGELS